jgi:hypothetical protein
MRKATRYVEAHKSMLETLEHVLNRMTDDHECWDCGDPEHAPECITYDLREVIAKAKGE